MQAPLQKMTLTNLSFRAIPSPTPHFSQKQGRAIPNNNNKADPAAFMAFFFAY